MNYISKYPVLTYTWSLEEKDRICGHTFEVFDYYLFLKDRGITTKILIQDKISIELLQKVYEDKYNYKQYPFPEHDINIIFKPEKIIAPNIIYTSGLDLLHPKLITNNLISFRCNKDIDYNIFIKKYPNIKILQDKRIYNKTLNSIHYIKKFYFPAYKELKNSSSNLATKKEQNKKLIYLNSNLRILTKIQIKNLIKKYSYDNSGKDLIFVSGNQLSEKQLLLFSNYNLDINIAPVENLFEKFNTYIYTSIQRQFDCSPRLLTESFFYKKNIFFDFNFKDYAGPNYGDTGLYWRWYDIQNNFKDLILKENDLLLKVLNE